MNIIITGASRGIGKAIATAFAAENATLFLCARNIKTLEETATALRLKYPQITIHTMAVDLSKKEEVVQLGKWILETATSIDILINNAGLFLPGNSYNEPDGLLEQMLATNLYSAYHLTRILLPKMIAAKKGHIFNISSIAGENAYPNGGSYSISKFALAGFSKNLREELKPMNIKVTTVYPGAVLTDSWGDFDNSDGRIMEATDIAAMILAASKLSPGAVVEEIILRPQQGDL
jgi:short-subunit dehydrogenase